jgi:phosphoglycolate phosphatase-like HAD superfamily hydrolase
MAQLLLRGTVLGDVKAVLFDKDGTLSISEPQLITLAEARVFLCLQRVPQDLQTELRALLLRAYGLKQASGARGGPSICPAGITAVASRDHNLIATATALVQVGLGWPEALSLSEEVFAAADQLDARRASARPSNNALARPSNSALARPSNSALARPSNSASFARPGNGQPEEAGDPSSAPSFRANAEGAVSEALAPPNASGEDTAAQAMAGGAATHLDSAGRPCGGTSRTTDGLFAWLEQLRSTSVVCAVISNDDVAGIEHFLASHGLEPFFQAIWSAEHRPRKPDPAAVHGLCAELGLAAADCALIGDANSDLRMAVAAGIPHQLALGYTAAWSTPPPLAEPHPLVHHWHELSLA